MPYAYYAKLGSHDRAIYRASDRIDRIALSRPEELEPLRAALEHALAEGRQAEVQRRAQQLADAVLARLGLAPVAIKVLAKRPSRSWGELHGEYQPADGATRPVVRVWMRTAQHRRIVAFKTFLRTLLHELCHHLDYALLGLADSFHTEGFFKRESSLFQQVTAGAVSSAAEPAQMEPSARGLRSGR